MLVAFLFEPRGARRKAGGLKTGRRLREVETRSRAVTLIVVGIHATRIVGVVLYLVDVTHEEAAGVHRLQVTKPAVERPRRILKLILVKGIVEQRYLQRL